MFLLRNNFPSLRESVTLCNLHTHFEYETDSIFAALFTFASTSPFKKALLLVQKSVSFF